ncbi:hypothetical protein [Pseudalkalibacillus berkeleyi]|uniref:Uncharacterized protein n=1 Tax=Pseudalkalibacillus berkeleyi TaxID=1069813 RepID=A0ABS9GYF0_9BACL|nr:hypothetical protein [Pseudalkalibacillus berkeleyi]MCF6136781.1 hypothetical protein [Pseudalkalibacillus berkeleyi]
MKNLRFWLHTVLLVSFALPWLKIPLLLTSINITGYSLPYKASHFANELNTLGLSSISHDQILPLYVMLIAPTLSLLFLYSLLIKRTLPWYVDSIAGFIAVMSCLFVMTNIGNILSIGFYTSMAVSLLLVSSPLLNTSRTPFTRGPSSTSSINA